MIAADDTSKWIQLGVHQDGHLTTAKDESFAYGNQS